MQGSFKRIWQWIQQFFGQFFGLSGRSRGSRSTSQGESERPLTDTDYEFLFSQLLEGVAHGWHEGRILKYFEDLGQRGKPKPWIAWLERFGEKAMASSAPNLQLAARMMRLGELAQSFPATEAIGETAYEIGRQIYNKESESGIWEYEGPDAEAPISAVSNFNEEMYQTLDSAPQSLPEGSETLTLEELGERLEQDSDLAEQLAAQLGIPSSNPQEIINALMEQFQAQAEQDQSQETPQTEQEWFNLGLEQARQGDLEGAIASWDRALEINPSLAEGWHNRGSALGTLGRFDEAINSFDRAIYLDAQDFQAWNLKGNALYNLQQWEGAITCWDKALEVRPEFYQAWYNRSSALEELGRTEEAIAGYRKALEIEPTFELASSRLKELTNN